MRLLKIKTISILRCYTIREIKSQAAYIDLIVRNEMDLCKKKIENRGKKKIMVHTSTYHFLIEMKCYPAIVIAVYLLSGRMESFAMYLVGKMSGPPTGWGQSAWSECSSL